MFKGFYKDKRTGIGKFGGSGADALDQLSDAVSRVDARYVLVSFNDEGFVGMDQLRRFLNGIGHVDERKLRYNTFRGSRNLRGRNIHVNEHLFLVRKF